MADDFELNVDVRTDLGKGASRRLRRLADLVPAVLYGANLDPVSISIPHKDLQKACANEAFFAHIIKLNVAGKNENAIIKDLQRHPAKDRIMHADFQRVRMDQEIFVEIPIHFVNEESCHGVKQEGGMVSHIMSSVEVACLPGDLPEYLEIDVLDMHIGDSVHMSEIALPNGVTIPELALGEDHDHVVVSVVETRATLETDEDEEAAAPEAEVKPEDSDESED